MPNTWYGNSNDGLDLFKELFRQVLYDQNDFNEVLRKTDETMASVKSIFHDSVSRKSGNYLELLLINCGLVCEDY